jgi:hypothetical protein
MKDKVREYLDLVGKTLKQDDFSRLAVLENETRIFAGIGDLHGHYRALEDLLYELNDKYLLFNDNGCIRENAQIVFTGDYIDRGNEGLRIIEKIIKMQRESANIITLFGNHELMALADLNKVKSYLGRSKITLKNYKAWTMHGFNGGMEFVSEFGSTDSEAFANYVNRMSKEGDIGGFLRRCKGMHLADIFGHTALFVHGGIPYHIDNSQKLEEYNKQFEELMHMSTSQVGATRKFFDNSLAGEGSIFWDRELNELSDDSVVDRINRINCDYLVIAHTPQRNGRIRSYADRVFNIDIGMNPRYGNNKPGCIVFKNNGIFSFYTQKGEEKIADYAKR